MSVELSHQYAPDRRCLLHNGISLIAVFALWIIGVAGEAHAQQQSQNQPQASGGKPNILVIFGDDIGQSNVSAYSMGLMGYRTPNIDRIAKNGMIFTDYYAEQSCTAGRSTFITGQATLRTGLSKVGIPAAPVGLQARDITIAQALKPLGYATGQFGKNHLGDKNEYLPTVHGFDEFFGNLYHLNAEEEPETFNYPRDPKFREMFGPRGVLRCKATDADDPTEQPRWGRVGKQTIEDTGPLTRKRMETIDDETSAAAMDYMDRQVKAGKPFFCLDEHDPHASAHPCPGRASRPAGSYRPHRICRRHDRARRDVGELLKKARRSRDRRQHDRDLHDRQRPAHEHLAGRGDDAVPQREEHELGGRLSCARMIRWPGHIAAGQVSNETISGLDWFPTLLAAAGDPDVKTSFSPAMRPTERPSRSISTATISFRI